MKSYHGVLETTLAGTAIQPAKPNQQVEAKGKGTILLVDDEPGVRGMCRVLLERAGYGVIEADSATSAENRSQ